MELSSLPSEHPTLPVSNTHPTEVILAGQESDVGLLYSVSDRNNQSCSKVSVGSKPQRSSKSKRTMVSSKMKSSYRVRGDENMPHLS
jgi:hypothetical protein